MLFLQQCAVYTVSHMWDSEPKFGGHASGTSNVSTDMGDQCMRAMSQLSYARNAMSRDHACSSLLLTPHYCLLSRKTSQECVVKKLKITAE
jgi:hypothetical protein